MKQRFIAALHINYLDPPVFQLLETMVYKPLNNIQSFLSSKPPVVVFIFCLCMMAIACISFSYYIKVNRINSPDVSFDDLNELVENITKSTLYQSETFNSSKISMNYTDDIVSLSVLLIVELNRIDNHSSLGSTSFAYINKTTFHDKSDFIYSMVVDIPSSDLLECDKANRCLVKSCATLFVPKKIVPHTPTPSTSCSIAPHPDPENMDSMTYLSHSKTSGMNVTFQLPTNDYEFYIQLSPDVINIISIRLMNSSYILFIAVLVILIFGFIRSGKPQHYKDSRQPLI